MEVFKGIRTLNREFSRSVVTIGNFDGVHLGHRKIIGLAVQGARKISAQSIVYTFRPHPRVALQPEKPFRLLNTYDEKIGLISGLGPNLLIEEPFSREFSTTSADDFFEKIIIGILKAEAVVVGHDFSFGRGREGHLETLKSFCQKTHLDLTILPPFTVHNEIVSSSKIRSSLDQGKIEEANLFLGYRFSYQGIVVKGDGRGRKLGFPTCNLQTHPKLDLPLGVYLTWTVLKNRAPLRSVTNIGIRPTFQSSQSVNGTAVLVETHILDFSEDLYGLPVEIQFVAKLREEKKFESIETLKEQIQTDIGTARSQLISYD